MLPNLDHRVHDLLAYLLVDIVRVWYIEFRQPFSHKSLGFVALSWQQQPPFLQEIGDLDDGLAVAVCPLSALTATSVRVTYEACE